MISVDSNQSSRTPRASTSCTAAMAVASARNPVQSSWIFVGPRVGQQREAQAHERHQPDRHQHVERPAPAVGLGEIAAEHRADHGRHADGHAEDRQHHGVLAARKRVRAGWSATAARPARRWRPGRCARARASPATATARTATSRARSPGCPRPSRAWLPNRATSQPVIGVTTAVARILKVIAQAISSWVADMAPCICGRIVEVVSSAVE